MKAAAEAGTDHFLYSESKINNETNYNIRKESILCLLSSNQNSLPYDTYLYRCVISRTKEKT